jgi:AGCS family alanine or glycine:cation symporter
MLLWLERMLWSGPLLVGLMGSHVFFTVYLRGVQRWTFRGIAWSLQSRQGDAKVSPFGALATSLAAAIGTGNIVGVATAVALGGPGAVLWCWLTGILGMATRYAESLLSLRHPRKRGTVTLGGPMYVMEDVLRMPRLAQCFALCGVAAALGTGALLQANAVGTTLVSGAGVPRWASGVVLTGCGALVILGGVGSIAKTCEKLVPAMSGLYLLGCLWILVANRQWLPEALRVIVTGAFTPRAAGGGFVGSTLLTAVRYGTARGLFTNEAGMGTAPLAAVTGPCAQPVREAVISMTGVFWDTVVICAMTGLVLVTSILRDPGTFDTAAPGMLCLLAFAGMPLGKWVLMGSLVTFAFATVVGWSWYGESCWHYLGGNPQWYRLGYLLCCFVGVFGGLETVWSMGGVLSGLMALPNLLSLFLLRHEPRESLRELSQRGE